MKNWLKVSFLSFLLAGLFALPFFVKPANAEERIFYSTGVWSSQCLTGSQFTPLNDYTLDDADLIIIRGSGFGTTEDESAGPHACWGGQYIGGVFILNGSTYSQISCFTFNVDNQPIGKSFISWNDSEIKFYAPKSISNNIYTDNGVRLRIYDTYHGGGNNCKTATLSLSPICSSFTYSDWTSCSVNGTQTRTVLNSSPSGCSGGNPILIQSCTPVCTNNDYSCSDWSSCSVNGNQTRTCNKTSNCEGGVQMPAISQSCTYTPPTCTSWTYFDWSICSQGGIQTRTIINSYPNSCIGGSPVLTQNCSYVRPCTANDYSCGNWSACSQNGQQTRTCNKTTNCQDNASSPAVTQSCTYTPACISFYYSSWSECSSEGKQTRSITSKYPSNCEGGVSSQTTQSCTPSCASDTWSCSDWNSCSTYGTQTRTCTKTFDCPTAYNSSPATSQSCKYVPACERDVWECESWGSCSPTGTQTRSCSKTYDCLSVENAAPATSKFCESLVNPNDDTEGSIDREKIIKATVKLVCPLSQKRGWANFGSGTIIDQYGAILTNRHVISETVGACKVGFITNEDDIPSFVEMADVKRISTDTTSNGDMAILKIRNTGNKKFTAVDILQGNSDNLKSGDYILPFGYPNEDLFGQTITFTEGGYLGKGTTINVCGYKYYISGYFKTDALIDHGNSGGGAYQKSSGYFMGIPTLGTSCNPDIPSRVNYILSISSIKRWLNSSGGNYSVEKNNFDTLNNYYSQSAKIEDINLATIKILDSTDNINANTPDSNVNQATDDTKLINRLKGKLLLQVEQKGKIWYVAPSDGKKHEVTFANALSLFQKLAVGITDANLNKIPLYSDKWNSALGNGSKGKLFLQVERGGKIWYIDFNGKRWEVTWANLMDLFKSLALGITDSDLNKIQVGN